MNIEKISLLKKLYATASWLEKNIYCCKKGCATCCTQSVTMSSLEGEMIYDFLEENTHLEKYARLVSNPENRPYRPKITTNRFARICIEQNDLAVQTNNWSFQPCIFLEDGGCQIYEVRPFSCRAFVSMADCQQEQTASVPPVIITLNTIIHQIIEHFSIGGRWGNMLDILFYDFVDNNIVSLKTLPTENILQQPEPLPGLLVDDKERRVVQPYLEKIGEVLLAFKDTSLHDEVQSIQHYFKHL